jgi:hypothetical protein
MWTDVSCHMEKLLRISEQPLLAGFRNRSVEAKGCALSMMFLSAESGGTSRPICYRYPLEPAAALVCRKLRHEVLPIFYHRNCFSFRAIITSHSPTVDHRHIEQWLSTVIVAANINAVEIVYELHCSREVICFKCWSRRGNHGVTTGNF